MSFFDSIFYSVFNFYKSKKKASANKIAIYYITFLQIALLFLSGLFFALFLNEMNTTAMSSDKAWMLFIIASIIIYFRNWITYSGKKRKVLNANQSKLENYNIWLLWLIPPVCIVFSIVILNKV
jgi:drug/metabolite transporter (DMT)-like permease